ncbi:hypothetical protein RRG08_012148 [Elysia crispata]|uniref:Uncharacterized protein n=1 Tax=Elysia crispata TaxID=231223 RepID=A0AAE0ZJB9_9GAST|nr:hypothetical protein RRG08_012148 [Elysia crispata]
MQQLKTRFRVAAKVAVPPPQFIFMVRQAQIFLCKNIPKETATCKSKYFHRMASDTIEKRFGLQRNALLTNGNKRFNKHEIGMTMDGKMGIDLDLHQKHPKAVTPKASFPPLQLILKHHSDIIIG